MSAGYKTKTFNQDTTFEAGTDELGWDIDGMFRDQQISVIGLDGGDFDVDVLLPGEEDSAANWRSMAAAAAQTEIVKISNLIFLRIRITFHNLGGAADPKVTITSILRGL